MRPTQSTPGQTGDNPIRHRRALEHTLLLPSTDFSNAYVTVRGLADLIQERPLLAAEETIGTIKRFLLNPTFRRQTQAQFLYLEAAAILTAVLARPPSRTLQEFSYGALLEVLLTAEGQARRATARATKSLPLGLTGPSLPECFLLDPIPLSWSEYVSASGLDPKDPIERMGRSLVIGRRSDRYCTVVKLAGSRQDARMLVREVRWMEHLAKQNYTGSRRFDIPVPHYFQGNPLIRFPDLPWETDQRGGFESTWAIAFTIDRDYFRYLNEPKKDVRLGPREFQQALNRNAWLLGKLAGSGIYHTAPIPLFHNRVQRQRRNDQGLYDWSRGGRLDAWLESTRYPNLGVSGIRDFEHFAAGQSLNGGVTQQVGSHILSLLLIIGSYFRFADPDRIGLDSRGQPVDVRGKFDQQLLETLIAETFLHYYKGFVGRALDRRIPLDVSRLSSRMIEEMGVDRHMEEILRVEDQRRMSREQFEEFLMARGLSREAIRLHEQGAEDISIHTGPHLGAFNQRISLPELVDFVALGAAVCVAGRFMQETEWINRSSVCNRQGC